MQPRDASQGADHLLPVRALVHDGLAFLFEQRTRHRFRELRSHQLGGAHPGPDDQPALVRRESDVARVEWGEARQHVRDCMQVELRGERADESPIRLADRDGEEDRGLAERPVPVGLANERLARSQTGQPLRGEAHAPRPAVAARHDAPARIEDQKSFLIRESLAKRVEVSAQTAERFATIPSLDFAQVLSDDVRAGRSPQGVEALVKP